MTRRGQWIATWSAVWTAAWLGAARLASGADESVPLDLGDSTPRSIEVRFETSPADQPGRMDSIWSAPRLGLLEPGRDADHVHIRIPAHEMESHLLQAGTVVIPGTFSDFVWTIARNSGQVVEAQLAGRVYEEFSIGLIVTRIPVDLRVAMSTEQTGGFRTARVAFGRQVHVYCQPTAGARSCVPVEARPFDPARGYVNAIGEISAATPIAEVRSFSPLGEVRFSERSTDAKSMRSPTPIEGDAVCSQAGDGQSESARGGQNEGMGARVCG